MGLDTRAYRQADEEWQRQWVEKTNEAGERTVFFGLAKQKLEQPVTLEDAPHFHQDDLLELAWPGGLIGGMISSACGDGPSFRGKAYDGYVEVITGESLYAACDGPWMGDTVRHVAEQLRAAVSDPDGRKAAERFEVSPEEQESLARWFEVCVENDLAVAGDY